MADTDTNYAIAILKYATLATTELGERIMRLGLEDAGVLPDPKVIRSKLNVSMPYFLMRHVHRNLLSHLCHFNYGNDLDLKLLAAIDHTDTSASMLFSFIIPLDMSKEENSNEFVDVYLVKEECIIRIDKKINVSFFEVPENSKYKKNLSYVIQVILVCYQNLSSLLREKERALRMDRDRKEAQEKMKSQTTDPDACAEDDEDDDLTLQIESKKWKLKITTTIETRKDPTSENSREEESSRKEENDEDVGWTVVRRPRK